MEGLDPASVNEELQAQLSAPFDPSLVKWRIGATNKDKTRGMALCYIDARHVMKRLDEVVGTLGWSSDVRLGDNGRVAVGIGIWTGVAWIWKWDGAGATDVEGDKGSISDGLKRAAVHWGIGRYLYEIESPWIEIEQRGRTSVIPDKERSRLAGYLGAKETAAQASSAAPAEPSKAPAKYIDKKTQKQLYQTNFKALEAIGMDKEAIDAADNETKFAPINFATASVGADRLDELYVDQVEEVTELMRTWVRREREKARLAEEQADHAQEAPPDDDDYNPDHEL